MSDYYFHHVMWYTVYNAKTGELVTAGTSAMCAAKLGYKNANSFASAVVHGLRGKHPACKYTFTRERIERSEVDSLPPARRKCKKGLPVLPARTSPRVMRFDRSHHPEE